MMEPNQLAKNPKLQPRFAKHARPWLQLACGVRTVLLAELVDLASHKELVPDVAT